MPIENNGESSVDFSECWVKSPVSTVLGSALLECSVLGVIKGGGNTVRIQDFGPVLVNGLETDVPQCDMPAYIVPFATRKLLLMLAALKPLQAGSLPTNPTAGIPSRQEMPLR